MKSSTAIKPKAFIAPVQTVNREIPEGYSIGFEFHKDDKLSGYLIDLIDPEGKTQEVFFLPTTLSDVEEWVFDHGEEDIDFRYEKQWDDDLGYFNAKVILEDNWKHNVEEYILSLRKEWVQHE